MGPGNTDLTASHRLPHVLSNYRPLKCQTGSNRRLPPVLDRTMDLGSGMQWRCGFFLTRWPTDGKIYLRSAACADDEIVFFLPEKEC